MLLWTFMHPPFIFICIVCSLTILINFFSYLFLQIQYTLLGIFFFCSALIHQIKFFPFLQENSLLSFLSPCSNLDGYPQIYSIAFLLEHSFSVPLCQNPYFLSPVPFSFSGDSPVWLKLCRAWEGTGGPTVGVRQTFNWHLSSHRHPPNILRCPGEFAHFLLVSPLLCSLPSKYVWNPLCTEDSLRTEVLFVLKSLYCPCPFRSLKKRLWRENGSQCGEWMFGMVGAQVLISMIWSGSSKPLFPIWLSPSSGIEILNSF